MIRARDLQSAARAHLGASLPRGWLDARIDNLRWQRITCQGYALPGRPGRTGPHLRNAIYRGVLPTGEADEDESLRHASKTRVGEHVNTRYILIYARAHACARVSERVIACSRVHARLRDRLNGPPTAVFVCSPERGEELMPRFCRCEVPGSRAGQTAAFKLCAECGFRDRQPRERSSRSLRPSRSRRCGASSPSSAAPPRTVPATSPSALRRVDRAARRARGRARPRARGDRQSRPRTGSTPSRPRRIWPAGSDRVYKLENLAGRIPHSEGTGRGSCSAAPSSTRGLSCRWGINGRDTSDRRLTRVQLNGARLNDASRTPTERDKTAT